MAKIKCRYCKTVCELTGERIYAGYDCENAGCCEVHTYDGDPPCRWIDGRKGEFEKNVKNYEFVEDEGLTIGKFKLYSDAYAHEIRYLEIDGRVLVNIDSTPEGHGL